MLGPMDPFGFQAYIIQCNVKLILELTKRARWKLCLREDIDEIRSGNKINEAERELLAIENYINYASFIVACGIKNPEQGQVCRWINEAQEAAFCLEDQIAMYRMRGFDVDDLIVMKSAIGKKSIKDLTSTIKNCIRSKPDEVQKFESNSSEFLEQQLCEISPFVRHSHNETAKTVFGMDNTFKELKELLRESYNHSVIFVIGEKGSGKTTIVKSLYEDNYVRSSFGPCSWVEDTAQITNLASFLRKVLKVEGSVEDDTISELEIMNKVQETFHGEGNKGRYLIVLDDVEDTCALHTLKHVLKGCKGKIICLTTRKNIEDDVLQDDTKNDSKTIMINPLEASDAYKLLVHVAFPGFQGDEFKKAIEWKATNKLGVVDDLRVTEMAKKITILEQVLVKCMGNPWNIQTAGKLLETNPFERWDEIQEQINGMLVKGNNREIGKVDPPIALDDDTLSLSIWRGFLYCLAFPQGSEISAQKLARLWMAEGFVQDSPFHSQEHEAESRLQVLIGKNLLVEKKKGVDGKVLKCSINQHIRPLALKMCKVRKFCRLVPGGDTHPSSTTSPYRVLSVHGDGAKEISETLRRDIRLRSLLYFGTKEFEISFSWPHRLPIRRRSTYRLLQTLELEGARLGRLPRSIGCLVFLRYLGLRNTQLEDLPASFNRLKKLLCLDIRDNYITTLDDVSAFAEMRHLHLAKSFRNQSVLISEGLRSLVNLRTLSGTVDGGNLVQELSYLSFLRKLSIKVSTASSKNICSAISNMGFLHSLAITAYDEDLEKEKTNTSQGVEPVDKKENISDGKPHKSKQGTPDDRSWFDIGSLKIGGNIRKLKLGGNMGKLSADRISMMHSLTHLYLWDSKLDVDVLLYLQGLRDLLLLSICNASTYSKLSCTQGGYRKLKKLSIVCMESLTECTFGRGAMKNLEDLKFTKCVNLTSGSANGLEHILCLKHVYLSEMHPDFVNSVKTNKPKDAQILDFNMHLHKSSKPTTEGSETTTPEFINPPATEGEETETMAVNRVTLPRGAKDNIQSTKSCDGAAKLTTAPQSRKDSLEKGKGILVPNSRKYDSDARKSETKDQTPNKFSAAKGAKIVRTNYDKEQIEQLMTDLVSHCMDIVFGKACHSRKESNDWTKIEQSKKIDLAVEKGMNQLARFRVEPAVIQLPYCVESYLNAVQNQPQIDDRSTSNIDASGVETLHMDGIETSVCYKDNVCHLNHLTECEIERLTDQKVATNTTLSNEERTPEGRQTTAPELVFPPRTEGEGDQTTRPRDAEGTTQNTKFCDSDDGDKAGQTSSMIEIRQNSEQAKEQQTKDQSSDVGALIPRLKESELHDDDSAEKNASTAGPIQSSRLTSQHQSAVLFKADSKR